MARNLIGGRKPNLITKLKTMKTKFYFILFLIWNRALVGYFRNFYERALSKRTTFFHIFSERSWINAAFMLYDTPEGEEYWKQLNRKWDKFLEKFNK